MKIDDIDLLKQWLVNVLNPIFDGDPEKLALYIVALAKKVEDDRPSRERCINDLEVFLETHTHTFVDTLFETLISKKYLSCGNSSGNLSSQEAASSEQPPNSNNNNGLSNKNTNNRINPNEESLYNNSNRKYNDTVSNRYQNESKDPRDQRSRRFNNYDDLQQGGNRQRYENNNSRGGNNFNKGRSGSDRDSGRISSGRERHKNRSRNRTHRGADSTSSSSSSSPEASSSSRRFDGERSKHGYRRSRSRSSRSRSNSPKNSDNNVNKKKRCRDFDEKGICTLAEYCPYDHGEVVIAPVLSNPSKQQTAVASDIESKQHMNQPQNFPDNMSQQTQGPYNPSNTNEMYQQHQNYQRGGMRGGMNQMRGGMIRRNPNPVHMPFPNQPPLGMQGGMDQPRFPNQNISGGNQIDFSAQQDFQQRQMLGNRCRNLVNIPTSIHQNEEMMGNNPQMQGEFMTQRGQKRSYTNLNAPVNDSNIAYQNPSLMNAPVQDFNNQKSLLPNPPMMPNQLQQQYNKQPKFNMNQPTPSGSQTSNVNNNNQSSTGNIGQLQQINSTLVLRKVPNELNRSDVIRQHFIKFGQIVEIQCKYDNHNDAALIRFANNQQAFAAFKSPESILNNRFIRIHWLNHYQKSQNFSNQGQQQQQQSSHDTQSDEPIQKRLATIQTQHLDFIKNKENKHQSSTATTSEASLIKTKENSEFASSSHSENNLNSEETGLSLSKQETGVTSLSTKPNETPSNQGQGLSTNFTTLSLKQTKVANDESHKIEALKLQVKQKARELIEQQIKDQKLLLKKFEQAKTVEEKSQILNLVKKLNESIEKQKEILNNKIHGENQAADFNQSPFSFQKNPSHTHSHPVMPKNLPPAHSLKLNNMRYNQSNFLKSQQLAHVNAAKSLNQPTKGIGSPKSTVPAFTFSKATIDNRPKKLIITGVENSQEKEAILNFVNAIGCQVESATEEEKNEKTNLFSFIISFCTRKDAEIALTKCSSSLTSKTISITWFRSETNVPKKETDTHQEKKVTKTEEIIENNPITESSNNDKQVEFQSRDENKIIDHARLLSEIDNILDDKSLSITADSIGNAEATHETEQNKEEKDVVDALFDDSANYETDPILS